MVEAESGGFHAERSYFSPEPWEHYDPMTGNLLLTFTDLVLSGNAGRDLAFQRTWNNTFSRLSQTFQFGTSQWTFGFPGMVMRVVKYADVLTRDYENKQLDYLIASSPKLLMADGSELATVFVEKPTNDPATRRWVISGDLKKYDIVNNQLWMPDGTRCTYDADGFLAEIRDPFGNIVTLDRGTPGQLVVTQYLGGAETRVVVFDVDSNKRPTRMRYRPLPAVPERVWEYGYDDIGGRREITSVTTPENIAWLFTYEWNAPALLPYLTSVTSPTLGHVDYHYISRRRFDPYYPNDESKSSWEMCLSEHITSSGPTGTAHGVWAVDYSPDDGTYSRSTTITMPSAASVTFTFGPYVGVDANNAISGVIGVTKRTVKSSAGIELETEDVSAVGVKTTNWGVLTGQVRQRTLRRPNESATTYTTTFTYDPLFPSQYHRPSSITETGELTRTTNFNYRHYNTATLYRVGLPVNRQIHVDGDQQDFWTFWDYFDDTGAVKSVTLPGLTTRYTYSSEGNAATVTDPHGQVTTYTYSYGQPTTIQTPKYTITRGINADGTLASETRGARTTLYTYDDLMRPTKVTPPGGSNFTQTTYETTAEGTSVLVQRGNSWTRTTLDGFGRPIATVNSVGVRTTTTYDAEGRVEHEGIPYSTGLNLWTQIEYDALGRVTKRTNPDGSYKEWVYAGPLVRLRDENAPRETTQRWAAFGHPDDRWLAEVIDAKSQHWSYTYNAVGSLKSVTAPDGRSRTWEYSNNNLLIRETHPESGMTQYFYLGDLLSRKDDANGNSFTYTYDSNGRLATISVGGKSTNITYEPDSDHKQSITAPNASTMYVYDEAGRITERKDAIGAYVFYSRYAYDANDNIVQITYPSHREIQYQHDSENRVTRVFEPITPPRDYASAFTYHPSGALSSYTAGNSIQTVISYDLQRYWIRSVSSGALQISYDNYDGVGNVGTVTDSRAGMNQQFTYDELDRLKTATGPVSEVFEYDVHGNRTNANGATYTYEPQGTLRLQSRSGIAYTYDNNGNLKTAGPNSFTYTPENWLATAVLPGPTRTYVYDSDGWRSKRTTPDDKIFYTRGLANEVLTEWHYTSSGTRARDYVYAGGRLINAIDRTTPLPSGCGGAERPDGTPIPITIGTAGGSASVTFEGSGCRRVSVKVTQTSGSLGCGWYIELRRTDTNALVIGPANSCLSVGFLDAVELPIGGLYSVTVRAAAGSIGSANIQIYDVVDVSTPITSDGLPVPVDLLTPGQNARLPFTGTNGHRMSLLVNTDSGNFGCGWKAEIRRKDTDGLIGMSATSCLSGNFLEPVVLPSDAEYVVVVNPVGYSVGSAAVHLYDVADVTTAITSGAPAMTVDLTIPGRNTRLEFSGLANQRMSVWVTVTGGNLGCPWSIEIRRKDTDTLVGTPSSGVNPATSCLQSGFLEPVPLPIDGNYVVVINPGGSATGTATVQLNTVVDATGTISADGVAVPIAVITPGQNARLTFGGTTTQRVSATVTITNGTFGCIWNVRILKPDNTPLATDRPSCYNTTFFEPWTLQTTGTHTLVVDPQTYFTGGASVNLYNVLADVTGTLTINGDSVPVALTTPGQNASLTFTAAQGQSVTVRLTANTITGGGGYASVSLIKPNGQLQTSGGSFASSFNLTPQTLVSGTYTVKVDPSSSATGNITVQVTSP